jgi:hypothetical protein
MSLLTELEQTYRQLAYRLDHCDGVGAADLYAEDCEYGLFNERFIFVTGRSGIEALYDRRRANPKVMSRHVFSNLTVVDATESRVCVVVLLHLYGRYTEAPGTTTPILIADFHDELVHVNDEWQFAVRLLDPILGEPPTF